MIALFASAARVARKKTLSHSNPLHCRRALRAPSTVCGFECESVSSYRTVPFPISTSRLFSKTQECATMSRNGWFDGVPETITALAGLFPGTFVEQQWLHHKPLKLGIRNDLVAAGTVSETEIGRALQFYCRRPMYLRSCIVGAVRIDLSGKPSGVVSETDAAHAATTLASIMSRREQKAKAAADNRVAKTEKPQSVSKPVPKKPAPTPNRDGIGALRLAAQKRRGAAA
jgi:ProP effector